MTKKFKINNKEDLMVYTEQVDLLYKPFMLSIVATFGMAILLVLSQWKVIEHNLLIGWLLAIVLVTLLRAFLAYLYKQNNHGVDDSHRWGYFFIVGAASSGITWGVGSILFFHNNDFAHQVIILLVIHGVSAGAVTTLSSVRNAVYAFIVPTMFPLLPLFIISGTELSTIIGLMLVLSFAFLVKSSGTMFYNTQENIQLRLLAMEKEKGLIRAIKQADEANLAKSEFLSNMSHELRTPMNAILGFAQVLKFYEGLSKEQEENVNEILMAGNHLLELINEVLDLARIESGKLDLCLESVELSPLVDECFSLLSTIAKKQGVSIHHDEIKGIFVHADKVRLKQILLNLLSNAIKYNRAQGTVNLQVSHVNNNEIRIMVIDTGKGITRENLDKLFQPFNRLDADNSGIEGTGIGLSITYNLVEMMAGRINVDSEPGIGSRFWVDLPKEALSLREERYAIEHNVPENSSAAKVQHTILYIEDNPANLKLVSRILSRQQNIKLITADEAVQGISLARTQHPDLILLDISMPHMDGYQTLNVLQADKQLKKIPVIAVTANAKQKDVERGNSAGFSDYLTKPFNIEQFILTVTHYLN